MAGLGQNEPDAVVSLTGLGTRGEREKSTQGEGRITDIAVVSDSTEKLQRQNLHILLLLEALHRVQACTVGPPLPVNYAGISERAELDSIRNE